MTSPDSEGPLPEDSFAKFGDVKVHVGGTGCGCLVVIGLFISISLTACGIFL